MLSFHNINLTTCDENSAILLLCTKMYYNMDEISEGLRFDTLNHLSNNVELIDEIFLGNNNIDKIKKNIIDVNNFIIDVNVELFSKMFENNTHIDYIEEKFNCLKRTPTYFIVTRDKNNLKKFLNCVESYKRDLNIN